MKRATVRFITKPDALGRRRFTITWTTTEMQQAARECGGKCSPTPSGCLHHAERGQCFFAVPGPHIKGFQARGFKVVVVND